MMGAQNLIVSSPSKDHHPEIQGLRAVAVALVLVFHLWPQALTGGFVGVDVFFVISGYLITDKLARTAQRDGGISLLDFYSGRARRLLPAATVVLIASFAGMLLFLPESRWHETATQIAASALYVQNWVLSWLSVDYLGAEDAASPVQHYWSLSIEEQFYFVWPLVMIGALHLGRRWGLSARRAFVLALSLIFASSLAASVWITAQEPARAYFVTHTRIWELALGGLLALTLHRLRWSGWKNTRAAATLLGLAAIVWSAFAYSPATDFPGTAALVPTLGTALVIAAGDVRVGWFHGLNARWLTWLGDRSYSIYLWHWPLIVFYSAQKAEPGLLGGLGLAALTLVLSHLSYEHVEQRYRHARASGEWRPLGYALASILGCVVAAGALQQSLGAQAAVVRPADPAYPGSLAILYGAEVPAVEAPIPPLAALKSDLPRAYVEGCHVGVADSDPNPCRLGDPDGVFHVVLAGDSHAANWIPALDGAARVRGWRLDTHTKSGCTLVKVPLDLRGKPYDACKLWGEQVLASLLADPPDVVVFSQSTGERLFPVERDDPFGDMVSAIRDVWADLAAAGIAVVAIGDTPRLPFDPDECLGRDPGCAVPAEEAIPRSDPLVPAAAEAGVPLIDMTDAFCTAQSCPLVIGNVIAWRDWNHLTATYSRTIGPALGERIESSLKLR